MFAAEQCMKIVYGIVFVAAIFILVLAGWFVGPPPSSNEQGANPPFETRRLKIGQGEL